MVAVWGPIDVRHRAEDPATPNMTRTTRVPGEDREPKAWPAGRWMSRPNYQVQRALAEITRSRDSGHYTCRLLNDRPRRIANFCPNTGVVTLLAKHVAKAPLIDLAEFHAPFGEQIANGSSIAALSSRWRCAAPFRVFATMRCRRSGNFAHAAALTHNHSPSQMWCVIAQ